MQPGTSPRGAGHRSIAASALSCGLALACVLAPASARAAASSPGDGGLSPRLAELAKPSVRSAPPARQAKRLGLAAEGPGSLLRDGNRVLVEARFDHGAAAGVGDLRAAGAEVVNVSRRYQTVTVAAKPDELRALSKVPRIVRATEVLTPIAYATESTCPQGVAVSEGDEQLHAREAREAFGVSGEGVTVGILSDSFDKATKSANGTEPIATSAEGDVASGDLPGASNTCPGEKTPVHVLEDFTPVMPGEEPADEGRAMAQIVHDLAPGANLAFATAFNGETGFAENIERLAKSPGEGGAGARVIADDVSYFEEPFFQEGPVGVAARNVTERGVSYFSSAGNDNLINGGRDIGSWEAPAFRDAGSCPTPVVTFSEEFELLEGFGLETTHCMDFDPGAGTDKTFGITVEEGATLTVDLQWAEAWEGVGTDLDAFLIGPEGAVVAIAGEDNLSSGRPVEVLGWENTTGAAATVQLAINRYSGTTPRLKFALLQNGGGVASTEYESSSEGDVVGPTIFGHNGGEDAISVAAMRYSAASSPEPYSSRGPVTHYFGPVSGTTPAAPLSSPQVLSKPDLTATDCGVTTFFASFVSGEGKWRFCGTSAAAPHAAAVAALLLRVKPTATPQEVRAALTGSAAAIGTFGPCSVGAGLLNANAAIETLLAPETATSPLRCAALVSEPAALEGGEEEGGGEEGGVGTTGEGPPPSSQPEPAAKTAVSNSSQGPAGATEQRVLRTYFRWHPRRVVRTRHRRARAVFWSGANERPVTFLCRVDRGSFRRCGRRFARRFGAGRHVVRVMARDANGQVDRTPAVYRFRVKRIRRRR